MDDIGAGRAIARGGAPIWRLWRWSLSDLEQPFRLHCSIEAFGGIERLVPLDHLRQPGIGDAIFTAAETARRRDAVIKRMLATPPKPHSEMKIGKSTANPKKSPSLGEA